MFISWCANYMLLKQLCCKTVKILRRSQEMFRYKWVHVCTSSNEHRCHKNNKIICNSDKNILEEIKKAWER